MLLYHHASAPSLFALYGPTLDPTTCHTHVILLSALDGTVANRSSTELIQWDDDLINIFKDTKNALSSNKVIALPRPTDHLWIVTDAAVKNRGIGATLYVTRDENPRLAGFCSAKLRTQQVRWLPC